MRANPYCALPRVVEAKLYVDEDSNDYTDQQIAQLITAACAKFRFIHVADSQGQKRRAVEFQQLSQAEKAFAVVNHDNHLQLHATLDDLESDLIDDNDEERRAATIVVRFWPLEATLFQLFDLCRPFGAIFSIKPEAIQPIDQEVSPKRVAAWQPIRVRFYDRDHARKARDSLHASQIGSSYITVDILERDLRNRSLRSRPPGPSAIPIVKPNSPPAVAKSPLNPTAPPFRSLSSSSIVTLSADVPNVFAVDAKVASVTTEPKVEEEEEEEHAKAGDDAQNGKSKGEYREMTIEQVAALPAKEILELVTKGYLKHLELDEPDRDKVKEAEYFCKVFVRNGSPPAAVKSSVGQRLWPVLKQFPRLPAKQRNAVMVQLVDEQHLKSLVMLSVMAPRVFEEMAVQQAAAI